jgi:hypothetical protein
MGDGRTTSTEGRLAGCGSGSFRILMIFDLLACTGRGGSVECAVGFGLGQVRSIRGASIG